MWKNNEVDMGRKRILGKSFIAFTLLYFFVYEASSPVAQDIGYAREVVRILCSDTMKGRGYVDNGDRNAAHFLAGEFEKAGLKKYGKTYFQTFTTPVNSFPGSMSVSINGKRLKPGEEFLVEAGSPGISGKFAVELLTAEAMLNGDWIKKVESASSKFVVVDTYDKSKYSADEIKRINEIVAFLKYGSEGPSRGTVVLSGDKLTWSGSVELFSKPAFTIKASVLQDPISTIEISVENRFIRKHQTQNVIGCLPGVEKDSFLVFTAHYDHLGMMGKETMFPGANDNASGVAFLLNLVKHYTSVRPKYTMIFIAFAAEEIGLVGSKYFTEHPLFPLSKIKFLLNFDMAGTGDDGIQIVNGRIHQRKFDLIKQLNDQHKFLKEVKIRGEACNSDHCMFHAKGVDCFFIYTLGGIQAYHDINDRADTLPFTEFEDYFKLMVGFVDRL